MVPYAGTAGTWTLRALSVQTVLAIVHGNALCDEILQVYPGFKLNMRSWIYQRPSKKPPSFAPAFLPPLGSLSMHHLDSCNFGYSKPKHFQWCSHHTLLKWFVPPLSSVLHNRLFLPFLPYPYFASSFVFNPDPMLYCIFASSRWAVNALFSLPHPNPARVFPYKHFFAHQVKY